MAKCELCGTRTLLAWDVWTQLSGNVYRDYYDSIPLEEYRVGGCKCCTNCVDVLKKLFGLSLSTWSDNEVIWAKKIMEAKNFAMQNRGNITNPRFADFVDYAIGMADRLIQGESNSKIEAREKIRSFVTDNKDAIDSLVAQFSSADKVLGEKYKFYLKDDRLQYTMIDVESADSEEQLVARLLAAYEDEIDVEKRKVEKIATSSISSVDEWKALHDRLANPPKPPVTFDHYFPSFALDDILYFCNDGDVQYASIVEGGGGGGGGANMAGALLGGMMFGGVGAIVGSQVGTEVHINPIKTTVEEIDTRKTLLVVRKGSGIEVEELEKECYNALLQLIPTKERKYVISHQEQQVAPAAPQKATGLKEQLSELKELLDIGIISQEEFDAKKKQLLGL